MKTKEANENPLLKLVNWNTLSACFLISLFISLASLSLSPPDCECHNQPRCVIFHLFLSLCRRMGEQLQWAAEDADCKISSTGSRLSLRHCFRHQQPGLSVRRATHPWYEGCEWHSHKHTKRTAGLTAYYWNESVNKEINFFVLYIIEALGWDVKTGKFSIKLRWDALKITHDTVL